MRQILLGKAPLGQGGAVGSRPRFTKPHYLLNDTFTTDRAAGAVNGTLAEPGPGVRVVTDTGGKLSLTGGGTSFATAGAASDPRLYYQPVERRAGLMLRGTHLHTTQGANWGLTSSLAVQVSEAIRLNGTSLSLRINATGLVVGTIAGSTRYQLLIALRASGAAYFIKGGTFTNWTLLWISDIVSSTPLTPMIEAIGTSSVCNHEFIRIPPDRWLPAPTASDGFSVWGTTDGLGHAEGIVGGLGSGGSGLAWSQNLGTWQASGGVANASALSSGVAIATVDSGKADVIAALRYTHAAGTGSVLVRYVDNTNWVRATHTGANAQLVKNVAGVQTTLIDTAATYVAGAELRVSCQGQAFRLYYNNALIGSEQTIADVALQSGTKQGIRTTDTANTFDDFTVYARGAGGEYSALDAF